KIQELVERDRIQVMIGPLDTASALAADDYIRQAQLLTLSVAAAEDMTQRKPNPWFTRGTSTSSQSAQPLADYCAKTLKYKRMATIADDIAYGHEMCAGFQRVFEDAGGKIVQKLFSPLTVPDYGTYIAQLKTNVDGIFLGFAGSNGFRFYDRIRRSGSAQHGRRGARHRHLLLVLGGDRERDQQALCRKLPRRLGLRPGVLRRRDLCRSRGARSDSAGAERQHRGQAGVHEGRARHQGRHRAGARLLRPLRQRCRERLYPQSRAQGRAPREPRHPHLPEREPVLDLQAGGVPEESGVLARLAAREESRVVSKGGARGRDSRPRFLCSTGSYRR
ncbi:MAG: hypothetical protein E6H62_01270, partial [Betaproteobacteria bacterium]